ncbi:hypothetical protein [Oceanobacillus bengalensis]|nr:hypothetical protein [Oceanobacillus bengalensis]
MAKKGQKEAHPWKYNINNPIYSVNTNQYAIVNKPPEQIQRH